jgi:gamma-glutamyltranspeptidase/glutathione hydrolase
MRYRQRPLLVLAVLLLLAACGGEERFPQTALTYGTTFYGGAASDEPRAALIARDILAQGGSAADAAITLYLSLAVTLPSRAGLGGGGLCLVFDPKKRSVEALDFLPRAPAGQAPPGTTPVNIPGALRGMAALHARYGLFRWEKLVAQAEALAGFNTPVSRSLARDLSWQATRLAADPEVRRIFFAQGGRRPYGEGEKLFQPDLANLLGRLRRRGAGDFYTGKLAEEFAATVSAAGGWIALKDLRNFHPVWRPTLRIEMDDGRMLHFVPPPAAAGFAQALMAAMLITDDRFEDTAAIDRPHLIAEVERRAFGERNRRWAGASRQGARDMLAAEVDTDSLMRDYRPDRRPRLAMSRAARLPSSGDSGETSFITVDGGGQAVACSVTMIRPFGLRRMAPGIGVMLAPAPPPGAGFPVLGPILAVDEKAKHLYFAGASSGGEAGVAALVTVAANSLIGAVPLEKAIAQARIHADGISGITQVENGFDREAVSSLTARGHRIAAVPLLGTVNAILCTDGLPADSEACSVHTDLRRSGLAIDVDR